MRTATWITLGNSEASSATVRRVRLEVTAGPDLGLAREYEASSITIGAREGVDLRLADRKVSGFHARISLDERGYRLRDLESTNGTMVAGLRINDVYIEPNTHIVVGRTKLRFVPLARGSEVPLSKEHRFGRMVGRSPKMRRLFAMLSAVASSDASVLITGETGVGKELVAEAVHEHSPRCTGPLVILDCGSIPANLFESELFGHEKGAFTGALQSRAGAFERAHGGTVFLDEIGELPIELQPKLLRVLETKQVQRIGGIKRVACDVRVVAATNRDLEVEVNRGSFRADLYYRLDVARLHVPPLRERVEDIPLLIARFVDDLPHRRDGGLPADLAARLAEQAWPGNVRQLRNAVERALLLPSHPIEVESPAAARGSRTLADHIDIEVPFKEAKRRLVDEFDALYIEALLDAHDGNISAAARSAQVDRMTIYKLMDRLGRKR